jgi:uncharacterized membrane protein
MTGSPAALRVGAAAVFGQIVVQLAWHAWLMPGSRAALALAVLPLLPGGWIALHNLRRGVLVSGIVSLFYFCHGVAELGSADGTLLPAAIEVGLSLVVIGASYWDARGYRRRRA